MVQKFVCAQRCNSIKTKSERCLYELVQYMHNYYFPSRFQHAFSYTIVIFYLIHDMLRVRGDVGPSLKAIITSLLALQHSAKARKEVGTIVKFN